MFTRKSTFLLAAAAGSSLLIGGAAQATTVNQALQQLATNSGALGSQAEYRFQDRDFGVLVDPGGNIETGTDTFDVGDVVRGSYEFDFVEETGSGDSADFGEDGNNYLFGRYSIKIENITSSGVVEFGPDDVPNGGFNDSQKMFEFYESSSDPGISSSSVDQSNQAGFDLVGGSGHDLWATSGHAGNTGEAWDYQNTGNAHDPDGSIEPEDSEVGNWYANSSETLAIRDGLGGQQQSWLTSPESGLNGGSIGSVVDLWDNSTDFTIEGQSGNTEVFSSVGRVDTNMTVVPVPSSVWMGGAALGLLAMGHFARRRRQVVA